jgi:hypothetical protein
MRGVKLDTVKTGITHVYYGIHEASDNVFDLL